MIQVIPANSRYMADHGWLKTYHLFSFAEYFDPDNTHFGNLRVFNDDTILGEQGFGAHPHKDMEIVTIVLKGTLSHRDSMGNVEKIRAGEVQRMSAGTGVKHSEFNEAAETVHLYQIWIQPMEMGRSPDYEQMPFTSKKNTIVPLVTDRHVPGTLNIHARATISSLVLENGKSVSVALPKNKGLFVYLTRGELRIQDMVLMQHDQARITDVSDISFQALSESEAILIEVDLL